MKFRKKPIIIDAIKWERTNIQEVIDFMGKESYDFDNENSLEPEKVIIHTLEGDITASPGDWIIRGVSGELYPCKPDIFQKTYEPAE